MQNKDSQAKKENREGKASADKKIEKAKKTKAKTAAAGKKKNGAKPSDNTAGKQIKPADTVKAKAPSKQTRTTSTKQKDAKPRRTEETSTRAERPAAGRAVKNTRSSGGAVGRSQKKKLGDTVKISFLGGINEIGKNLTLFEYNDEMIVLDCGMSFPDADMPGVDYVLPDFTFLERNVRKIKAVFITHGHEDHIGGLPYLLKSVNVPVYCTCLTAGLIKGKLKEHRMLNSCKLIEIRPGDVVRAGEFTVEAIHVNHSIPDSLAFAIRCGAGVIVHTGDFKIDNTPIDGGVIDLAKFAQLGNEGVLCLMSDSTNAERPGYTPSEKNVGETLETLFRGAGDKRIIVASFASNIHRIQQIVDASVKMGRKIFLSGRSLENVVAVSMELGYINIPDGIMLPIDRLKNYTDSQTVIITTGSQGEPMSALSRMAQSDHRKVTVGPNDFIIISATPIPGNEKTVSNTINDLMKLGAEVAYEKTLGIHVSGHAAQEDQKLIINLVRPKYFIPVHGEQKHLRRHAASAADVGIPKENIVIPDLGALIEVSEQGIAKTGTVPAGRVYIDVSGIGDVANSVLQDRKKLSTDGIVAVTGVVDAYSGELLLPVDVQSRGIVFSSNANEFSSYISDVCGDVFHEFARYARLDIPALKSRVRDAVAKVIYDKTRRAPVIIVTVLSV
ncbi:MAG: ribonuclease J [Clostridia bacterium]|nr:ribonuclease J [Clostridia bacterium]